MAENANRTFICSVLFLDIVEYSKRSVTEQIRLKEIFNAALSKAIAGVAVSDRIILDTGDGAAVSFLGDPEDAMFVGLDMRDDIAAQAAAEGGALRVRFGINLGPVRPVKDINGQPNIIGDGINVAQRVMSFAEPGQVLVSRSYFDVMERLSDDYAGMFHYEGARTDKHVREHEVYAVGTTPRRPRPGVNAAPAPQRSAGLAALGPHALAARLEVNAALLIAAPLAFVLIVGAGIALRGNRHAAQIESPGEPVASSRAAPPRAAAPAVPVVEAQRTPALRAAAKPAPKTSPRVGNATLLVSATPSAEIYVDGKLLGVTPPPREIALAPGRHRVEMRNAAFAPHVELIEAKPGERLTLRYRFPY